MPNAVPRSIVERPRNGRLAKIAAVLPELMHCADGVDAAELARRVQQRAPHTIEGLLRPDRAVRRSLHSLGAAVAARRGASRRVGDRELWHLRATLPCVNAADGHLFVVDALGRDWLFDTGAKHSFGRETTFALTQTEGLAVQPGGTLLMRIALGFQAAGMYLPSTCVGLLGTDIIDRLDWRFVFEKGTWGQVTVTGGSLFDLVPPELHRLPLLQGHVAVRYDDTGWRWPFLDTGAPVSYLPGASASAGPEQVGTLVQDFMLAPDDKLRTMSGVALRLKVELSEPKRMFPSLATIEAAEPPADWQLPEDGVLGSALWKGCRELFVLPRSHLLAFGGHMTQQVTVVPPAER